MPDLELINKNEKPPAGFRYTQAETGFTIEAPSWLDLLKRVKKHREANNLPIGLNFNRQVEQQLAEALPATHVQPYEPAERWPLPQEDWPLWAKGFALLKTKEDKGVGDTIARLIGDFASDAFRAWHRKIFNAECHCSQRQWMWNEKFAYA